MEVRHVYELKLQANLILGTVLKYDSFSFEKKMMFLIKSIGGQNSCQIDLLKI